MLALGMIFVCCSNADVESERIWQDIEADFERAGEEGDGGEAVMD